MLSLRILLVALGVSVTLSACSLDQVLVRGGSEATPSAGSAGSGGSGTSTAGAGSSVSSRKVVKAASAAVGAQVVVKPGQYLLCKTTDQYKERTTSYYICRERRCVGQETLAKDAAAPKSKTDCMNACRKLETKKGGEASVRAYCVS